MGRHQLKFYLIFFVLETMSSFEVTFESKECLARCGVLKSRGNTLNTPCVFIDTQFGFPTFLSVQQLKKANLPPHGLHIDLGNIFDLTSNQKSKKNKKKNEEKEETNYTETSVLNKYYNATNKDSIHSFIGLNDYLLLMDYKNLHHRQAQNGSDKFVILSTEHGKKRVNVIEYMNYAHSVQCDFYLIPSENIASNSSKSRCQKNVNRTIKLFENSLRCALNDENNQCLIASIEGGNDLKQRMQCLNKMSVGFSSSKIENFAFMIGGFGFGESQKQKNEILNKMSKALNDSKTNKNKLRIVDGLNTLDDVICAIANGIDLIISSHPTALTLNGLAMIHSISPNEENNKDSFIQCINVCDICFAADPLPILTGCECYCCSHHSRAYIRHLFNVHEMNAQILLQMHNLHRFLQFVQNIKEYMLNGKLCEFVEWWIQYQMKTMS